MNLIPSVFVKVDTFKKSVKTILDFDVSEVLLSESDDLIIEKTSCVFDRLSQVSITMLRC